MKYIDAIDYKLEIGSLEESSFSKMLESYSDCKKVIIVDENTHVHCLPYLITTFTALSEAEVILLPEGEENKQMSIAYSVWEALTEYTVSRNDLIINVGGGMITDLGGFIASCYKRGCNFINIPTSLLGMVDASIGGKTGINLGHFKNQIGVFSNPKAVFIDPVFLATLPDEELKSGYAEMLKHGLISSHDLFFAILKQMENFKELNLDYLSLSLSIKNEVVKNDPIEKGMRKILNFGHTIGHVIEGHYMDSLNLSHGHSVAIGMVMEAYLSVREGKLLMKEYMKIEEGILKYFTVPNFSDDDIQSMTAMLINDKKNDSNEIKCCLLSTIGKCSFDHVISEERFAETFMHFKNMQINLN